VFECRHRQIGYSRVPAPNRWCDRMEIHVCQPGFSQMQLQKSLEQSHKIPESAMVQHKIGVAVTMLKMEPNMLCKIN